MHNSSFISRVYSTSPGFEPLSDANTNDEFRAGSWCNGVFLWYPALWVSHSADRCARTANINTAAVISGVTSLSQAKECFPRWRARARQMVTNTTDDHNFYRLRGSSASK